MRRIRNDIRFSATTETLRVTFLSGEFVGTMFILKGNLKHHNKFQAFASSLKKVVYRRKLMGDNPNPVTVLVKDRLTAYEKSRVIEVLKDYSDIVEFVPSRSGKRFVKKGGEYLINLPTQGKAQRMKFDLAFDELFSEVLPNKSEMTVSQTGFDKPEIVQMIIDEIHEPKSLAENIAKRLNELEPELIPVAVEWACRKEIDGNKEVISGITLNAIMDKYNATRVEAILTMNVFLKSPHLAEHFKKLRFEYR